MTDQTAAAASVTETLRALYAAEMAGGDIDWDVLHAPLAGLKLLSVDDVLDLLDGYMRRPGIEDTHTYWNLVCNLHSRSDARLFGICAAWAGDTDPSLRRTAADVLAQLDYDHDKPHRDASEPILDHMLGDTHLPVVASALVALGWLKRGDVERIVAWAHNDDRRIRRAVVKALSGRDEPTAVAMMIVLSRDTDTDVRTWASWGLAIDSHVDTPPVRDALFARMEDTDAQTRLEAIYGLAVRGDRRAVPHVARELRASADVASMIIEAAGHVPDGSFMTALDRLAQANPADADIAAALAACRSGVAVPRPERGPA
jgi:hypothetical protein